MNLNEVKKHVKFDIIFTLLVVLGVATCLLLTLAYIFRPTQVKALTTDNITTAVYPGNECASRNSSGYCRISQASMGGQGITSSFGTYYGGLGDNIYRINFQVNTSIPANSKVTLTINGAANSFPNTNIACTSNMVSCQLSYASNDHINLNFTTGSSAVTYGEFSVYIPYGTNPNEFINNNNLFKINTIYMYTSAITDSGTQDVIDSSNQNTSAIISNNNTNTQNIINNSNNLFTQFKEFLSSCARNIINLSDYNDWDSNSGYRYYVPLEEHKTYTLQSFSGNFNFKIGENRDSYADNESWLNGSWQSQSRYVFEYHKNPNNTGARYLMVYFDGQVGVNLSNYQVVLTEGNFDLTQFVNYNSALCFQNKLDDISSGIGHVSAGIHDLQDIDEQIKDIQQDQYDYLTDNSDPTVNQSGINNALSSVSYSNPLDYLLTLPTHLLQKINTVLSANTCSRVSFGELYGTELYLPCIDFASLLGSNIWNTIDLFVGVGLLVLIIKHFYESITNILTLGKEKEVNGKLDLPTPMQFLAGILGGGRN